MFENNTNYNIVDLIDWNKINEELNRKTDLNKERRIELYQKLVCIHDWLTNKLEEIIKEKWIKILESWVNPDIDLSSKLDIYKIIKLNNSSDSSIEADIEKLLLTNNFYNFIIDAMYQNFINTFNYN
jgi:hypothetical protein